MTAQHGLGLAVGFGGIEHIHTVNARARQNIADVRITDLTCGIGHTVAQPELDRSQGKFHVRASSLWIMRDQCTKPRWKKSLSSQRTLRA